MSIFSNMVKFDHCVLKFDIAAISVTTPIVDGIIYSLPLVNYRANKFQLDLSFYVIIVLNAYQT